MLFALCDGGVSRTLYGLKGREINLYAFMSLSTGLCITAYMIILACTESCYSTYWLRAGRLLLLVSSGQAPLAQHLLW
jgi:hypothetical protein